MIVSVMYPLAAGQKFDLDYYMKTHIPLVHRLWGPAGLKSLSVLHGTGSPSGAPAAFHVIALLEFDALASFQAAVQQHGKDVMGDIPNFTTAEPSIQFSDQLA